MNEFYTSQSPISDPGRYDYLLNDLPHDLLGIARVVQGLIYHYVAGEYQYGYHPPKERMTEIDTRSIEWMLERLMEMDNRPLTEARSYENRILGCCRDFSLLAVAILRHQGVPARSRHGFASYFHADFWGDHVIVEAWQGEQWQRFDPQLANNFDTRFDLLHVPLEAFATGGRAWQMCRNEGADPDRFGVDPNDKDVRGWWFVRGRLQLDIASLNKQEMLCWDEWRYSGEESTIDADGEALLDRVAALSLKADSSELRELVAKDERLQVPRTVTCHSPASGPFPVTVEQ